MSSRARLSSLLTSRVVLTILIAQKMRHPLRTIHSDLLLKWSNRSISRLVRFCCSSCSATRSSSSRLQSQDYASRRSGTASRLERFQARIRCQAVSPPRQYRFVLERLTFSLLCEYLDFSCSSYRVSLTSGSICKTASPSFAVSAIARQSDPCDSVLIRFPIADNTSLTEKSQSLDSLA